VSARSLALGLTAAAVVVLGVYLFVEVRAAPAQPTSSERARADEPPHQSPPPPNPPANEGSAHAAGAPFQVKNVHPVDPPRNPPLPERPAQPAIDVESRANPHLDEIMREANKAYDAGDYDQARAIALKVLATQPGNVRMLRVVVSSACMEGDAQVAQQYYNQLPTTDRAQMRTRCADKMGMEFKEPASPASP
jgi:hypothetical protein